MSSKLEPAIWSRNTGQRIPCFDSCQLTITWMSHIKDVCCKLAWYWSHWHTGTGGRTNGRRRHSYKTKISRIDGLPYFLNYGAPCGSAFSARGAPLVIYLVKNSENKFLCARSHPIGLLLTSCLFLCHCIYLHVVITYISKDLAAWLPVTNHWLYQHMQLPSWFITSSIKSSDYVSNGHVVIFV